MRIKWRKVFNFASQIFDLDMQFTQRPEGVECLPDCPKGICIPNLRFGYAIYSATAGSRVFPDCPEGTASQILDLDMQFTQ